MPVSISETDIENYAKDGALLIKNLFTPDEVSDLREGIDATSRIPVHVQRLPAMKVTLAGSLRIFVIGRKIRLSKE